MNRGHLFECDRMSEKQVALRVEFGLLAQVLIDPDPPTRRRKDAAMPAADPEQLATWSSWRSAVQRPFTGAKKLNVPRYRAFLERIIDGDDDESIVPELMLYGGPEQFEVWRGGEHGQHVVAIPLDAPIIAIDGETQLAARFDLLRDKAKGASHIVRVSLIHGVPLQRAQQEFWQHNAGNVRMSAALVTSRNFLDETTNTAREIMPELPPKMQEGSNSDSAVSIARMRQAVCYVTRQRLTMPKTQPPSDLAAQLDAAKEHLVTRVRSIYHLLEADPDLSRPAMFIACLDPRVTVEDIEGRDRSDGTWRNQLSRVSVELIIARLRQPLLSAVR